MGGNEKLIKLVRGFDCLWMVKSKAYKDVKAKENAWKAVSRKVNRYICLEVLGPSRPLCERFLACLCCLDERIGGEMSAKMDSIEIQVCS